MAKDKELKVVALDHGNVFVKGYNGNKTKPLLLPNQFERKDIMEKDQIFKSKLVLHEYTSNKYDDEVWLWGDDIYKSTNAITTYTQEDRYAQKPYKLLTELALSELCEDGDELFVVTGMPSTQLGSPYQKELLKAFDGSHIITKNDEEKIFKVKETVPMTQPLGTLMYLYLDDEGNVQDGDVGEEYIGVIDIGGGTADLDGIKELDPMAQDRATIHKGMYSIYEKLADYINSKNPEAGATSKLVEFQILGDNPDSYRISKRSSMDIGGIKHKLFKSYAEDVITQINQRWTNRSKFDRIYMTGGAVRPLASYFKEWEKDLIIIEDAPQSLPMSQNININQLANVIGFYRYGVLVNNS